MKWGLIGASAIAGGRMIGAFRGNGDDVIAVQSSGQAHADSFAAQNDIGFATTRIEDLLAQPGLDAVYISSTNEKHFPQAMAAIAADTGLDVMASWPAVADKASGRSGRILLA